MTTIAQQLNNEIADVLDSVRKGLVQITSGGRGGGAGTIWHSDGLILTNAHVVQRDPIEVTLQDGSKHKARVLAHDSKADIAAIKIDASNLPTVPLGDSRELVPGQLVFALGHPLGVVDAATAGVVIGIGSHNPDSQSKSREFIEVGLNLRPGNSGGPLIDALGQLVGINSMMTGPSVGMAVPAHTVKEFLKHALHAESVAA